MDVRSCAFAVFTMNLIPLLNKALGLERSEPCKNILLRN
jgi:hypothetical protein